MGNFLPALEYLDTFDTEEQCRLALQGLLLQEGCICGRILPATNQVGRTKPRVQVFFQDEEPAGRLTSADQAWLPDGLHHRLVPESLFFTCTFPSEAFTCTCERCSPTT